MDFFVLWLKKNERNRSCVHIFTTYKKRMYIYLNNKKQAVDFPRALAPFLKLKKHTSPKLLFYIYFAYLCYKEIKVHPLVYLSTVTTEPFMYLH